MTTTAPDAATAPATDVVYDVRDITLTFGGVTSLSELSLQMHRGEILAIIGPNGAGKTSLFNSLTGVYTPQHGSITVAARTGDEPTSVIYQAGWLFKKTRSRKTHVINHLGVARTFQNIRLFPALTALENVKVGVETRMKSGPVAAMLGLPRQRREER
jgi:branched-chain amino acid transport system ATP-binding protein